MKVKIIERAEKIFKVVTYDATELSQLIDIELTAIAVCYRDVFNTSGEWEETWTTESALKEVQKAFAREESRDPVVTIIWDGDKAIGFGWGLLTDVDHLVAERDMPFALPVELKQEGLAKAKLWLSEVAGASRVFLYRDFGVLKASRDRLAGPLTQEILNRVKVEGVKPLLYWTSTKSQVYNIGIGMKWVPFHYFPPQPDGKVLTLMIGNVFWTADFVNKFINDMDTGYREIANRIAVYRCM